MAKWNQSKTCEECSQGRIVFLHVGGGVELEWIKCGQDLVDRPPDYHACPLFEEKPCEAV